MTGSALERRSQFQSTHPRGVRRWLSNSSIRRSNFNPRTHVGCDPLASVGFNCLLAFQSTHPRGVRLVGFLVLPPLTRFQSTHPRGVRQLRNPYAQRILRFQSTHPRGVRRKRVLFIYLSINFNPRTHVGCDLSCRYVFFSFKISIHAPTWGATLWPFGRRLTP